MRELVVYNFTEDHYSVITLNRPNKHNAISISMANELKRAIEQAKEDGGKFLVIQSINGDVFCAGGDLKDFHSDLSEEQVFPQLYKMKEVLTELISFPVPTICLLSGDAYGGGCELATACDIRIAKENTKFGFVQSNLGILPGWGGGALLYEKVHSSFALRWLMEGSVFSSSYLHKQGWIHQEVPEDQWDEKGILKAYITKTREQMTFLKTQYKENLSSLSLSAKMNEEVRLCSTLWGSQKHKQAIESILNKTNS